MTETATEVANEATNKAPAANENAKAWTPNPTLTHESLARYVTNKSGLTITPEQAQALLKFHGPWQKSPEREKEREAEKQEKAEAAARAAAERKAKAEEAKAAKAKADEAKKAKDAAKAAADAGDDSDLEGVDEEGETPKVRVPRKRHKGTSEAEF